MSTAVAMIKKSHGTSERSIKISIYKTDHTMPSLSKTQKLITGITIKYSIFIL